MESIVQVKNGEVSGRSSFGKPKNEMPVNLRSRRLGADPHKNESGTSGTVLKCGLRISCIRSGNGCCNAAKAISKSETPDALDGDFPHTIAALERRKDVVHSSNSDS
jgi:hypothetical protein